MGYKKTETNCVVHIIPLRGLNQKQVTQCEAIRREAGRCWTDMVAAHVASRGGKWLSESELKAGSRNTYALHSQTVQALAEKLIANVDTARELRSQGNLEARYPYRPTEYQTPTWKAPAIRCQDGNLILSNGQGRDPLVLKLPARYQAANIRKAELLWRADHYELAITIDTGETNPPLSRRVKTAGVDLGEVNIAAVVTDKGKGIVITGRYLRSLKRLRNKRHDAYDQRIKKCQAGSRRYKRLKKRKAQASAKFTRQQRDFLHKASRQVVEFCKTEGVAHISIGDVRDIANGIDKGRKQNQRMSQWPHGQMVHYITYKARNYGASTTQDPENDSTKTCCQCGHLLPTAPRGRIYSCPGCGSKHSRDGNGGANICSRKRYGVYGKVHLDRLTYLRPVQLRLHPSSRASDTGQSCLRK
jgi:putative transposase